MAGGARAVVAILLGNYFSWGKISLLCRAPHLQLAILVKVGMDGRSVSGNLFETSNDGLEVSIAHSVSCPTCFRWCPSDSELAPEPLSAMHCHSAWETGAGSGFRNLDRWFAARCFSMGPSRGESPVWCSSYAFILQRPCHLSHSPFILM
jgi:hypothetical protein